MSSIAVLSRLNRMQTTRTAGVRLMGVFTGGGSNSSGTPERTWTAMARGQNFEPITRGQTFDGQGRGQNFEPRN